MIHNQEKKSVKTDTEMTVLVELAESNFESH